MFLFRFSLIPSYLLSLLLFLLFLGLFSILGLNGFTKDYRLLFSFKCLIDDLLHKIFLLLETMFYLDILLLFLRSKLLSIDSIFNFYLTLSIIQFLGEFMALNETELIELITLYLHSFLRFLTYSS